MAYKTEIRYNSNSFKHGMSGHRLYYTWQRMKSRCGNPNNSDYADYGGRGILVEDPWSYSFQEFYKDMAPTYQEGMELDMFDAIRARELAELDLYGAIKNKFTFPEDISN